MFTISNLAQLPLGIGIGAVSVVAPWLLRPFLMVALAVLVLQGGLLYAAGGFAALSTGLSWLISIASSFAFVLCGIGIGRVAGEVLFR
jgi:hypothetical protein